MQNRPSIRLWPMIRFRTAGYRRDVGIVGCIGIVVVIVIALAIWWWLNARRGGAPAPGEASTRIEGASEEELRPPPDELKPYAAEPSDRSDGAREPERDD